ncbi:MAG: 23S rRNA (cytosine(1962)-C(5))-methyltransferase RlmI, partial [Kiritimatiellae bacterium]|nr:23S rRNA (cytosine(1962)-C(5))-methyltransferase RlmI [Kiritimatiellia bacterium]
MDKIFLRKGRERSVERRHPWIFSGAVERVEGAPSVGSTVAVCAYGGAILGYGSWSPQSQIRVRMLSYSPDAVPGGEYVKSLVSAAIERRASADGVSPLAAANRGV